MAIATGTALLLAGAAGVAGNIYSANKQSNAIAEGTAAQIGAANQALEVQQASEAAQIERLDPFTQFGAGFIPQAEQSMSDSNALFQPGAINDIMSTEQYGALSEDTTNQIISTFSSNRP